MFNNPFDSFHNTVAEAKEERERLDRLLTISTPRERLLVAGVVVLLLILAGWLFLGSVARSVAVDGVLVGTGEEPLADTSVQALVWVQMDVAPHIAAGMPAVVELGRTDGEAMTLVGEVATIGTVPLADAPAALETAASVYVHRVDIALDESVDPAAVAGRRCRIVIAIGRQPPIALFGMGRPSNG